MSVRVYIPTALRSSVGGPSVLNVQASTVEEAFNRLIKDHPELRPRIFDEQLKLHRFINIYVDGEDIRFKNDLSTTLMDGSEISIVSAMAGG